VSADELDFERLPGHGEPWAHLNGGRGPWHPRPIWRNIWELIAFTIVNETQPDDPLSTCQPSEEQLRRLQWTVIEALKAGEPFSDYVSKLVGLELERALRTDRLSRALRNKRRGPKDYVAVEIEAERLQLIQLFFSIATKDGEDRWAAIETVAERLCGYGYKISPKTVERKLILINKLVGPGHEVWGRPVRQRFIEEWRRSRRANLDYTKDYPAGSSDEAVENTKRKSAKRKGLRINK
jgi:hypothetical protein